MRFLGRAGKERVATSILWVPILMGLGAFLVLEHLAYGEPPAFEALIAGALLTAGAVLAEWPWKSKAARRDVVLLRWAVVGICLFWLFAALHINGPLREAAVRPGGVTEWGGGEPTEYMRGVLTMARLVSAGTSEAWLPISILVLLIVCREYREAGELE